MRGGVDLSTTASEHWRIKLWEDYSRLSLEWEEKNSYIPTSWWALYYACYQQTAAMKICFYFNLKKVNLTGVESSGRLVLFGKILWIIGELFSNCFIPHVPVSSYCSSSLIMGSLNNNKPQVLTGIRFHGAGWNACSDSAIASFRQQSHVIVSVSTHTPPHLHLSYSANFSLVSHFYK